MDQSTVKNDAPSKRIDVFSLLGAASFIFAVHLYNNLFTSYGFFRDELYYIACSEHLSFGYVDHPPFSVILLRISSEIFGDSLAAIRLIPSLAHAATVFFAGIIARQLGGGRFSLILAATLTAFAPGINGMFGFYSMNAVDILLWSVIFSALLKLIESKEPKYWIMIGLLLGIGLLNKISMGWLAAGIAAGIILTPMRWWLKSRWPWYAAGMALLIFLPFIVWNIQNDWAHLEFARNASTIKYASQDPFTFLSGLIMRYNPFAFWVWIAGFILLLRHPVREVRSIGIAVATVLAILLINYNSKSEYFNPAVIVLFSAGAVQLERWNQERFRRIGYAYGTFLTVTGLLLMPLSIDLLSPEQLTVYRQAIGESERNAEGKRTGILPQHFADRFGWETLARNTAEVFNALPPAEKPFTAIYVRNYGEASAIDFFGKQFGLPKAMCGHNSYWLWGNERLNDSVAVLIAIGGEAEDYHDTFSEVVQMKMHTAEYVMPYEDQLPIYVCRSPRLKIRDVWHTTKHYD